MTQVGERSAPDMPSPAEAEPVVVSSKAGGRADHEAGASEEPLASGASPVVKLSRRVTVANFALRLVVAGMFLDAGIQKIRDPQTFAEQIANYQLLSHWASYGAAFLPAVEIVAALTAIVAPRSWNRSATVVIMGMLVVFTGAIVQAWWRGINTDCGCFGQGSTPIGIWTVLRNSGLLLAAGLSLWLSRTSTCDRQSKDSR